MKWNEEGQCAREACRGDITEEVFFNTSTRLRYCTSCAHRINDANDMELCIRMLPPGRYVDKEGTVGELGAYDAFACHYVFRPDGAKPPAIIGPGIPYPYKSFALEEALEQLTPVEADG